MHTSLFSAAAAAALILAGTIVAMNSTNALAASRTLELPAFTKASISSGIEAKFVVGATQSVMVGADNAADFDNVHITVVDGRLKASMDFDFWDFITFSRHTISLTVASPSLQSLNADSGARVDATGMAGDVMIAASSGADLRVHNIAAGAATIDASSGSTIWLEGSCDTADVQNSSGALIGAARFECTDLDVQASSGSSALLHAKRQVNAFVSSGAKVSLGGNPEHVDDEVSSGGDVDIVK
jgi:hypothetical protein